MTTKWIEVNNSPSGQCSVNKNIRFQCWDQIYLSDACIVASRRISVAGTHNASRRNKKLTFKNNVSFRSCIEKIKNTFVDNAEGLDIVMPMSNF